LRALIHTALVSSVALAGCTGEVSKGSSSTGDSVEMQGAGGRDISEYWPNIDIPLSQNTRMLSFEMLRSEVMRATGRGWIVNNVDQWERNRGSFGGADFVTTFADDITPSQQRIVLVRKMAFAVCGDLVAAEAGAAARTVFDVIDPGAPLDAIKSKAQLESMFRRFFLIDPTDSDVADGEALITALAPTGAAAESRIAWRGVCASYIASMRFLTY
jgi:hypothetical protein